MSKRLMVSFKNNANEMELYIEILRHTDKSAFIKECIQYFMKNNKRGVVDND